MCNTRNSLNEPTGFLAVVLQGIFLLFVKMPMGVFFLNHSESHIIDSEFTTEIGIYIWVTIINDCFYKSVDNFEND